MEQEGLYLQRVKVRRIRGGGVSGRVQVEGRKNKKKRNDDLQRNIHRNHPSGPSALQMSQDKEENFWKTLASLGPTSVSSPLVKKSPHENDRSPHDVEKEVGEEEYEVEGKPRSPPLLSHKNQKSGNLDHHIMQTISEDTHSSNAYPMLLPDPNLSTAEHLPTSLTPVESKSRPSSDSLPFSKSSVPKDSPTSYPSSVCESSSFLSTLSSLLVPPTQPSTKSVSLRLPMTPFGFARVPPSDPSQSRIPPALSPSNSLPLISHPSEMRRNLTPSPLLTPITRSPSRPNNTPAAEPLPRRLGRSSLSLLASFPAPASTPINMTFVPVSPPPLSYVGRRSLCFLKACSALNLFHRCILDVFESLRGCDSEDFLFLHARSLHSKLQLAKSLWIDAIANFSLKNFQRTKFYHCKKRRLQRRRTRRVERSASLPSVFSEQIPKLREEDTSSKMFAHRRKQRNAPRLPWQRHSTTKCRIQKRKLSSNCASSSPSSEKKPIEREETASFSRDVAQIQQQKGGSMSDVNDQKPPDIMRQEADIAGRLRVCVSAVTAQKDGRGKTFQQFEIDLAYGTECWTVRRRHRDALALHTQLSALFPRGSLPDDSCPQKSYVPAHGAALELRRRRLQSYLESLIRIRRVRCVDVFRKFLDLDLHLQNV